MLATNTPVSGLYCILIISGLIFKLLIFKLDSIQCLSYSGLKNRRPEPLAKPGYHLGQNRIPGLSRLNRTTYKKPRRLTLCKEASSWLFYFKKPAYAHFGAVIPSDAIVTGQDSDTIKLDIKFMHPMEMQHMDMAKPKAFGVMHEGEKTSLLKHLKPVQVKNQDQEEASTYWTSQ